MAGNNDTQNAAVKLLSYCSEISTRFLLEASLNPDEYSLDFCDSQDDFKARITGNAHGAFIIDASIGEAGSRLGFFKEVSGLKFTEMKRIILLADRPMPPEANGMQKFGPLCFLEIYFSRARLNETLRQVMSIKDTGVRVRSDDRFFDITKIQY